MQLAAAPGHRPGPGPRPCPGVDRWGDGALALGTRGSGPAHLPGQRRHPHRLPPAALAGERPAGAGRSLQATAGTPAAQGHGREPSLSGQTPGTAGRSPPVGRSPGVLRRGELWSAAAAESGLPRLQGRPAPVGWGTAGGPGAALSAGAEPDRADGMGLADPPGRSGP